AGRLAVVADLGALLTGVATLAGLHRVLEHVAVDGDRAVVVLDAHPVAEPAGRACLDHGAVGDRVDRRAERVGDVDAAVLLAATRTELRRQPPPRSEEHTSEL